MLLTVLKPRPMADGAGCRAPHADGRRVRSCRWRTSRCAINCRSLAGPFVLDPSPVGRPGVPKATRELIRRMSRENPTWGAPRIHGELLKLGIEIAESTVSKHLVRGWHPPSQTWRTFLQNHIGEMVSVDFFTVPTI